jgi:hypothetical protein
MTGFRNVAAWANAVDAGKTHVTTFRKTVASSATVANDFIDYTYFAGNPPANFYASAPLEAAYVEGIRGIYVPTMTGTEKQYLKSITGMSAAASDTGTSNQNQRHLLADYLMYYPFVDTDAVGERQDMVQSVSLPRYNTEAVFGPELVQNPSFGGASWWTLSGASVSGGVLNIVTAGGYVGATKINLLTVGKKYYVEADVVVNAGPNAVMVLASTYSGVVQTTTGKLRGYFTAENTTLEIKRAYAGQNLDATIDNISVREVISQGQGGQVICVSQSASSAVGTFTMGYTNQDGVAGRTTQATFTKVVSGGGALVSSPTNAVAGSLPFVGLQAGDSAVRSIEWVNFSAAGGGLMALVIVQPLFHWYTTEECRRETAGGLNSFGSGTYFETVLMRQPVEIKNGAVLGNIGLGNAGSLASSTLVGTLQTIWS